MTLTAPSDLDIATPRVRSVVRRWLFWIGALMVVLIVAAVIIATVGRLDDRPPLSAGNPAPAGAQAVARVLADHGVTVTETSSLDDTIAAVHDPADTTVLVYDDSFIVDEELAQRMTAIDADLVLVDPGVEQLDALAPGVLPAGAVTGEVRSDCALTAATRAGSITGDGHGYRLGDAADGATACFDSGDDIHSLVALQRDGRTVTVLGSTAVLANETITEHGNAALALALLGGTHELVWYLPSAADLTDSEQVPTLGDLTPIWLTPLIGLLLVIVVVAGFWRGRRLGPLVVERLPVTVKASETMEGRARLYAVNSSRVRAVDALRVGTLGRLAALCGLPRTATTGDVILAVASVLDRDPADVRRVLVDALPASDRDLVTLSDELIRLERAVRGVLRPDSPPEG